MSDYKPRKRKCSTCDGAGSVRRNASTFNSYTFHKVECDKCDGKGFLLSQQRNKQMGDV